MALNKTQPSNQTAAATEPVEPSAADVEAKAAKPAQAEAKPEKTAQAAPKPVEIRKSDGKPIRCRATSLRIRDPSSGTMYSASSEGVLGDYTPWVESQLRAGVLAEVKK